MRRYAAAVSTLALAAGLAVIPSPALAASSNFGNGCIATNINAGVTYVLTAGDPANPLPATAPLTGVITEVAISLPPEASSGPYPQKVKVVRPAATPGQYTFVAESASLPTGPGAGPFEVRLPVKAGDLLGLGGAAGALICSPQSAGNVLASYTGDVPVGTTAAPAGGGPGASIPLVATVEPDVDKDGFGDETQDLCPQSAAIQSACPKVKLDTFAVGQNGSILALVSASSPAKVKVTGVAQVDGKNVKLTSKPKKVKPGQLGRFTLRLPADLKAALAKLPASRFITVKITATAPQVIGKKAKDTATVRLQGTR